MGDGFCKRFPMCGRPIRTQTITDLWDRSNPGLDVDMSLPGVLVVRALERLRLQGWLPQRIKVDPRNALESRML